jgi:membrane associated rhomboid family serine protease
LSASHNAPIFNAPDIVKWIGGATLLAHVGRALLPDGQGMELLIDMAFIPARYGADYLVGGGSWWPLLATPLSYLLIHGDFTHLLVNVLLFLAFGAAVARRMGAGHFLSFYALSGVAGAFAFLLFNLDLFAPVIGASGAVSGMVGAVCRLSFRPPDPAHPMPFHSRGSAMGFVVVWLVLNFFFGMLPPELIGGSGGGIAWETHLGGFLFGLLAIGYFDGRGLPPKPFEFGPSAHT